MHPPPVIFDEVQHAPDLFSYIKDAVDAARDKPGQYLLTGSQNLLLLDRVTKSLAGRATAGYVVHPGDVRLPLGPSATALPLAEL